MMNVDHDAVRKAYPNVVTISGDYYDADGVTVSVDQAQVDAARVTLDTVAAQVYDESRSTKYADWTVAYTNRSGGIVDISLSDTDTATFTPSILFYDVLLTEPGGSKNYYLEGKLFISEGYTA